MSVVEQEFPGTTPEYTAEAEYLAEKMRHFSASELEKMLKISPKLAAENYERYQRFGSLSNPRKQALFAYNGSVFKAIDPNSFSLEDLKYAQDRVRIVSTLYGLVRPLDLIQAYRIAFSVKLDGKNLYDYWVSKLTSQALSAVVRYSSRPLVPVGEVMPQRAISVLLVPLMKPTRKMCVRSSMKEMSFAWRYTPILPSLVKPIMSHASRPKLSSKP